MKRHTIEQLLGDPVTTLITIKQAQELGIKLALMMLVVLPMNGQDLLVNFDDLPDGVVTQEILGPLDTISSKITSASWMGSAGKVKVVDRALLCEPDSGVVLQKFTWRFAPSRRVSYGYSITLTNWGRGFNYYNPGGLESGGTYSVLSMIDGNSSVTFQAETIAGIGQKRSVPLNTPIWVTALWDSAQRLTTFHFYRRDTMVLLGISTMPTELNATVATMTWGITDNHSHTSGTKYVLDDLKLYTDGSVWPVLPDSGLPPVPPPPPPPTVTLTGLSSSELNLAIVAASNGDHIRLPAGTVTWNSGVTVSKNRCVISGAGMEATVITLAGGEAFNLSGSFNTISNLQIKGTGVSESGIGFMVTGPMNRITGVRIRLVQVPIYARNYGLADYCVIEDSRKLARVIFSAPFFGAYPLAWDSLNYFVFENIDYYITIAKLQIGDNNIISSQVAQSWVMRHCNIFIKHADFEPQPAFDFHGDDAGSGLPQPGVAVQIYSNRVFKTIGEWNGKFSDIRATRSLIYSNQVIGMRASGGITYREERPGASPNYHVTGSHVWANFDGPNGTTPMRIQNDHPSVIIPGVDLIESSPPVLAAIPYPHPLRLAVTVPESPVDLRIE